MRILFLLLTPALWGSQTWAEPPSYDDSVKPILRQHCLTCHNAADPDSGLDLSSYDATMKGGSGGVVVLPGSPNRSRLYLAMTHADGVEAMPPEGDKMEDAKIQIVRDWILGGLVQGRGGKSQLRNVAMVDSAQPVTASPLPDKLPSTPINPVHCPPAVIALATSPGAPLFAVSGHEQILLFGIPQNANDPIQRYIHIGTLAFSEGTVHDLQFSRHGTLLLAAGGRGAYSGHVVVFDVETGKRIGEYGDEVDSILAADISPDHSRLAMGNSSKHVKIVDAQSGKTLHDIDQHTDWITSLAFSPDGKWLASGDRSGGVYVWQADNGGIVYSLGEHKQQINVLQWRSDSRLLATGSEDGNLILWDMKDGFATRNTVAHAGPAKSRYDRSTGVTSAAFSTTGELVSVGRDRKLRSWSAALGKLVESTIESGAEHTLVTEVGVVGEQIVVGCFDGTIKVLDAKSLQVLQTLSTQP